MALHDSGREKLALANDCKSHTTHYKCCGSRSVVEFFIGKVCDRNIFGVRGSEVCWRHIYREGKRKCVPILPTETMFSELLVARRDIKFKRVPNVGHDLVPTGGTYSEVEAEYSRVMTWFEQSK